MPNPITQEQLRESVTYDAETGIFRWNSPGTLQKRRKVGDKVEQCFDVHGYQRISIRGSRYLAHILAWIYTYGAPPIGEIDHKNLNKSDNRLDNLRDSTHQQNCANNAGRGRTSAKGAYWTGSGWMARIRVNGKDLYLGHFGTEENAHKAWLEAAYQHFGEFANAGHVMPPPPKPAASSRA